MKTQDDFLISISNKILAIEKSAPVLVGIDGVDGSGKSCFAKNLVEILRTTGKSILHSSVDFFHNSSEIRKPEGKDLALSFFENSFNYAVLKEKLLDPLRKKSNSKIILKHFDHTINSEVQFEPVGFEDDVILIFDGIFLHRDEICDYWDFSIFLDVDFETTFKRMSKRDGCSINFLDEENYRYYGGQQIYLEKCKPKEKASLIIDNNDFEKPKILSL